MADTMTNMKFVYADLLTPSQLMEGDLINIDNDIVEVISIVDDATGDNYTITHRNEYGEEEETLCTFEDTFKLYVFIDEEEQRVEGKMSELPNYVDLIFFPISAKIII